MYNYFSYQRKWFDGKAVDKCRLLINAAVNGYLELTLLKGRQRFDALSTSNLEVYKF